MATPGCIYTHTSTVSQARDGNSRMYIHTYFNTQARDGNSRVYIHTYFNTQARHGCVYLHQQKLVCENIILVIHMYCVERREGGVPSSD